MWIPDGPWSDVMSFLLMDEKDFEARKEIEHYKRMTPTNLHFDNPGLCDHVYNICKNFETWKVTHKCCGNRGFMVKKRHCPNSSKCCWEPTEEFLSNEFTIS